MEGGGGGRGKGFCLHPELLINSSFFIVMCSFDLPAVSNDQSLKIASQRKNYLRQLFDDHENKDHMNLSSPIIFTYRLCLP